MVEETQMIPDTPVVIDAPVAPAVGERDDRDGLSVSLSDVSGYLAEDDDKAMTVEENDHPVWDQFIREIAACQRIHKTCPKWDDFRKSILERKRLHSRRFPTEFSVPNDAAVPTESAVSQLNDTCRRASKRVFNKLNNLTYQEPLPIEVQQLVNSNKRCLYLY